MDTKLDTKTILEKEFKTGLRGYNQEEVDLFLDDIIHDYEAFKKTITELRTENERMQRELESAQKRPAAGSAGTTNFDIIEAYFKFGKACFRK